MRRIPRIITLITILLGVSVLSLAPVKVAQAQTPVPTLIRADERWASTFYPNTSFESPLHLTSYGDRELNLNWEAGAPIDPFTTLPLAGMPADNFSVRFSTNWHFDAGIYEFTVIADGGVRLSIANNVIFDELGNQGLASFTGLAFIGAGPEHLSIEYIEYSGNALIQISWAEVTERVQSPEPTTQSNIVTAQVTGVDGLALRTGPYLGTSLIAVLRPGETYTVLAQNNTEGTYTWYKLVRNPAGQTGWASGRYLDVNFQLITEQSCAIQPGNELTIADQIVPGFSDTTLATQCLFSATDVLNTSIAADVTADELLTVTVECNSLLSGNASSGQVMEFIDDARLALAINNACGSVPCSISSFLADEIALQLAPGSIASSSEVVSCMNTIAGVLEPANISIPAAGSLSGNCAGLLLGDTTLRGILNFLDVVSGFVCEEVSIPTLSVPEETSIFENLTLLPDTGVTLAPRSVMNIRVRPSTRVATIGQIPWGAEAQVLARTIEAGEDFWYLIRYDGLIGWVDGSFVNVRGNINDVPIY